MIGADGKGYLSSEKGTLGTKKIYGRLDCKNALGWIAKGKYVKFRVFFKDEATAIVAGYHPCGKCMREHFILFKEGKIIPGDIETTKKNVDFL